MTGLEAIVDPFDDIASIPDEKPTSSDELRGLMARAMEQVRNEFEQKSWDNFCAVGHRPSTDPIGCRTIPRLCGDSP
jgi:hypothetical protein